MKLALILAAVTAAWLLPVAVRAMLRRAREAREVFEVLTEAEATGEHAHLTLVPDVEFIPDGFTCLRCYENPALPEKVWCAVCTPIVDSFPAEPIEHAALAACIARHPADKQRKTGGPR